ncbi:hypothetical protein AVEN_218572-1 [Araneus ventricosus]|uniref:Uncharacterized protein n=1 Tax=Araneus ventricosus TaxID=182803 RepID=A0A4Y2R642_ARAVE|nr:hypothetical protein AVEN_218572-1 [Araneus ventricosus]
MKAHISPAGGMEGKQFCFPIRFYSNDLESGLQSDEGPYLLLEDGGQQFQLSWPDFSNRFGVSTLQSDEGPYLLLEGMEGAQQRRPLVYLQNLTRRSA